MENETENGKFFRVELIGLSDLNILIIKDKREGIYYEV